MKSMNNFPENFTWGSATSSYQIEGAATGIIMLMSWVPALIAFAAAGVMSFYPLNKDKMDLITQDLTAKRVGS